MTPKYIIVCDTVAEAKRLLEKTAELLHRYDRKTKVDRKKLVLSNEITCVRFMSVRQIKHEYPDGLRAAAVAQNPFENMLNEMKIRRSNENAE
jgi:hypothetical protein